MKNETKSENTTAPKVAKVKTAKVAVVKVKKVKVTKVKSERGQGRPTNPNSVRQARLKAMAERAKLNGGIVKRGRTTSKTSARQIRLTLAASNLAKGIVVKRGRPALKTVKIVKAKKAKVNVVKEVTVSDAAEVK